MKYLKIYVDSSYDWNKTVDGYGEGKICICCPEKDYIKITTESLSVPGLKQLNNRFELMAITMGISYAKKLKRKNYLIYSDSRVAVGWAHLPNVLWTPRDLNEAGKIFDEMSGKIKK